MSRLLISIVVAATLGWAAGTEWPETIPDPMVDRMTARARIASAPMVSELVRATVFGGRRGKGHDGGEAKYLGRVLTDDDICVAHRSDLDMSVGLARALGFPGRGRVLLEYQR